MPYLIAQLLVLAVIAGFYFLTRYETARGARFFAAKRDALDQYISQSRFLVEHIDWKSLFREQGKRVIERLGHDVAHATLQSVRAAERFLTEFVRKLRSTGAHHHVSLRETSRPFVKTLTDFKGHLQATRPEMPEIR